MFSENSIIETIFKETKMIIQKDYYRRNVKTGDIVKRQRIWVKCDECGDEWETLYEYVKYKKLSNNLCKSCRCKKGYRKAAEKKKRREIQCNHCKKIFLRSENLIKKKNFCSKICSDKSYLKSKYGHLEKIFVENPNEVAYLFGLILGDGHLKKQEQKNTTRISIAFDANSENLFYVALQILKKLEIDYYVEPKVHSNCRMVGFVLPDDLLKKYELNYIGSKYKAQPFISKKISKNINFAAGMINSDGTCYLGKNGRNKRYEVISVNGITKSIIDSCCDCLDFNDISYRRYRYDGRIDKRNGNLNKDTYILKILRMDQIKKLREKIVFKVKEPSNG